MIGSPYPDLGKEGGKVDQACADITAFFRKEIERIIKSSDPYSDS